MIDHLLLSANRVISWTPFDLEHGRRIPISDFFQRVRVFFGHLNHQPLIKRELITWRRQFELLTDGASELEAERQVAYRHVSRTETYWSGAWVSAWLKSQTYRVPADSARFETIPCVLRSFERIQWQLPAVAADLDLFIRTTQTEAESQRWIPSSKRLASLISEIVQREKCEHIWGCWLVAAINELELTPTPVKLSPSRDGISRLGDQVGSVKRAVAHLCREVERPDHRKKRATLSFRDGKFIVLFDGCEFAVLSASKPRGLISHLYDCKHDTGNDSYEEIFNAVYGALDLFQRAPDGGPPGKLKTLASRLNTSMEASLGKPPGGGRWIENNEGHGYYLTNAVTWQFKGDRWIG